MGTPTYEEFVKAMPAGDCTEQDTYYSWQSDDYHQWFYQDLPNQFRGLEYSCILYSGTVGEVEVEDLFQYFEDPVKPSPEECTLFELELGQPYMIKPKEIP